MPRRPSLRQLVRPATLAVALAVALGGPALACSGDSDDAESTRAESDVGGDGGASEEVDGAAVYAASCAECHGDDLRGTDKGPSHLSMVYEPGHHPDESFRAAIEQGSPAHHWTFGDMPPVAGLSDAEVDAVIAFIRDQQEEYGFEPYPP